MLTTTRRLPTTRMVRMTRTTTHRNDDDGWFGDV
jgi:hypothetical protein